MVTRAMSNFDKSWLFSLWSYGVRLVEKIKELWRRFLALFHKDVRSSPKDRHWISNVEIIRFVFDLQTPPFYCASSVVGGKPYAANGVLFYPGSGTRDPYDELQEELGTVHDLFAQTQMNLMFILIHSCKNHWTLACIDNTKKRVEYYDSKKNYDAKAPYILQQAAEDWGFSFIAKVKKNLQPDSFQCGVWSCVFLKNRVEDSEYDPNKVDGERAQRMVENFRAQHFSKV